MQKQNLFTKQKQPTITKTVEAEREAQEAKEYIIKTLTQRKGCGGCYGANAWIEHFLTDPGHATNASGANILISYLRNEYY